MPRDSGPQAKAKGPTAAKKTGTKGKGKGSKAVTPQPRAPKSGKVSAIALIRPKSKYTEGGAIQHIIEHTGLKRSQIKPCHTEKAWRWQVR